MKTNVGSPKGRESYGDGGLVVVVRVTPHQGGRESRPQSGEGGQVIGHQQVGRYAKCRAPKRCWVSCVSAAGAACRWMSYIDSCSTLRCFWWRMGASIPTRDR